jgi:hypothetical protein
MTTSFVQFKETAASGNPAMKEQSLAWADKFMSASDRYVKNKSAGEGTDLTQEFKIYLTQRSPETKQVTEIAQFALLTESPTQAMVEKPSGVINNHPEINLDDYD